MTPRERQQWYRSVIGDDEAAYDAGALNFIANGPLADPSTHFCPLGKLTTAELRAREAAQWERLA